MGSATWQASHLSCRQTCGDVPENKILPLFTPYWLRCYIMYPPWNQHSTWKWMLGRLVSFLEVLFSGAMLLVARVVDFQLRQSKEPCGCTWESILEEWFSITVTTQPPESFVWLVPQNVYLPLQICREIWGYLYLAWWHTPLSAYRIQICNMTVNLQEMYNTTRCKWCIYTCIRYIGYIALLHLHIHHATSIRSTKIQHHRNIISG